MNRYIKVLKFELLNVLNEVLFLPAAVIIIILPAAVRVGGGGHDVMICVEINCNFFVSVRRLPCYLIFEE